MRLLSGGGLGSLLKKEEAEEENENENEAVTSQAKNQRKKCVHFSVDESSGGRPLGFADGTVARIEGLVANAGYNGQHCTVLRWLGQSHAV